jgi:hypothetical protein
MKTRFAGLVAVALVAALLAVPGTASASTSEAIADTGGMTLDLGVIGSPLEVSVTLDEIGHITVVDVGDGFTEDKATDHKVRFSNEDGSTRIDVRAKRDKLSASVKSADLSGIEGSHTWSGKLFGSTTDTVVKFDVINNGGAPEIANVEVPSRSPGDITPDISDVKTDSGEHKATSSVRVTFAWNGYTMTLKIKATADTDDDDDSFGAKLSVELRGRDIQKLKDQNIADLAGPHTWEGRLCDGTSVGVDYSVSDSGDLTVGSVTKAGVATDAYELKYLPHGFVLKFNDSKAKLTVKLYEKEPGLWDLKVRSQTTERCDTGQGWSGRDGDRDHGRQDGSHGTGDHDRGDNKKHRGSDGGGSDS